MTDLSTLNGNLSALIQIQTSKPARDVSSITKWSTESESAQAYNDRKTIEAAEKFEALLIHNMLKGMRKTTLSEDTSNERALYDDMLDEKLASTMIEAGGLGLARQIIGQIQASTQASSQVTTAGSKSSSEINRVTANQSPSAGKDMDRVWSKAHTTRVDQKRLREIASTIGDNSNTLTQAKQNRSTDAAYRSPSSSNLTSGLSSTDVVRLRMASELWGKEDDYERIIQHQQFLEPLIPHAKRNAERIGTSHEAILAIAALETGWGQSMIQSEQGHNSFNLFGIKATQGDKVFTQNTTTEYINGREQKIEARFRMYKNPADAVDGFANFVLENPRYSNALKYANNPERFLQELQTAGYATDPNYADKAISVMRQIKSYPSPL